MVNYHHSNLLVSIIYFQERQHGMISITVRHFVMMWLTATALYAWWHCPIYREITYAHLKIHIWEKIYFMHFHGQFVVILTLSFVEQQKLWLLNITFYQIKNNFSKIPLYEEKQRRHCVDKIGKTLFLKNKEWASIQSQYNLVTPKTQTGTWSF